MLTKDDVSFLENVVPKIKKLGYYSKCCSKKRKIILGEVLTVVFSRFGISEDPNIDPDASVATLNKYVFGQKLAAIEDRQRVLTILRNLKGG